MALFYLAELLELQESKIPGNFGTKFSNTKPKTSRNKNNETSK